MSDWLKFGVIFYEYRHAHEHDTAYNAIAMGRGIGVDARVIKCNGFGIVHTHTHCWQSRAARVSDDLFRLDRVRKHTQSINIAMVCRRLVLAIQLAVAVRGTGE